MAKNELQTTKPAEAFRAVAAERLHTAADMTLHQLVDEFQRLAALIEAEVVTKSLDDFTQSTLTPAGELALREQQIITGAAKARFGLILYSHDRD